MVESGHFSIVIADIEGSSDLSAPEKVRVRADLYRIIEGALERSGIAASAVVTEDRGDAVYVLVDGGVPVRRLIDPFLSAVDDALADRRTRDVKLRLRLVVHQGQVDIDGKGSSGPAVDRAFAMVDAAQLKELLKRAGAGRLAAVVGDDIYQQAVRGHDRPDPYEFRKRLLTVKGGGEVVTWVTVTGVPDQPAHGRPATATDDRPGHAVGGPSMTVNTINGSDGSVIGSVTGGVRNRFSRGRGDR